MTKTIYIITNLAPHYRLLLWKNIFENRKHLFYFLFGQENTSGIKQIDFENKELEEFKSRTILLKNRYLKKKFMIWQSGVVGRAIFSKLDVAIVTGDAWVVSNWIIAIILKLRRKKVVFWSHGLYGNEKGLKKRVRILFYRLADAHLLYERRAKELMINEGFKENKLHVIFNSLDYDKSIFYREQQKMIDKNLSFPFFKNPENPTLLFIGRLTPVKKLDLLINAFNTLVNENHNLNLLLVGDGPIKEDLSAMVDSKVMNDNCHFYGSCYSEEKLAELISASDLCVSPGNVGLTAIHCLSYGTPVLTHDNFFNQMPEVGAINLGKSGLFFKENDISSLREKIIFWIFKNKQPREKIREACYEIIDELYNPKYQVKVLENLIDGGDPFI